MDSKTQLPKIDILLFFCTCNPPHRGHLYALQTAHQALLPSMTLVIPPAKHVWGKQTVAFKDRVAMAKLAFAHVQGLQVATFEQDEHLSGYTIDSLHHLTRTYPHKTFGMVVGADTLEVFHTWKAWEEILSICALFVVPRVKDDTQLYSSLDPSVASCVNDRIFLLSTNPLPKASQYSSSFVRLRLQSSEEPVQIDPKVRSYIAFHRLYQD